MNPRGLLVTPEHRLRAPWRITLFIVVMLGALLAMAVLELGVDSLVYSAGYEPLVSEWAVPLGILLATWVMLKWVDHRSWDFVGLAPEAARPRLLVTGTVLGVLPIAVPSAILLLAGQLKSVPAAPGSWWGAAAISLGNLLPAAFGEELLMRGYIFAVLREAVGARWSLLWTSIVFGLLHIPNPGSDAQSIAIVMMAGVFLGAIFLATRSLYAATMAHFIWNWFMAAGLHAPVSGLPVRTPDYRVIDSGPDWLTGGQWGPEGGFAAAVGMFVVLIYLYARPLRRMES